MHAMKSEPKKKKTGAKAQNSGSISGASSSKAAARSASPQRHQAFHLDQLRSFLAARAARAPEVADAPSAIQSASSSNTSDTSTSAAPVVAAPAVADAVARAATPARQRPVTFERIADAGPKHLGVARFALSGSESRMAEAVRDPRLPNKAVIDMAAHVIQTASLRYLSRLSRRTPDEPRRARALAAETSAARQFDEEITGGRRRFAESATAVSRDLMASSLKFKTQAKKHKESSDFRLQLAKQFEQLHPSEGRPAVEQAFIERMRGLASSMRGSMYFHADDQDKIFQAGGLFAKHTRGALGLGSESHTTATDERELGNHDHVFFYLEHADTQMRANSSFATPSTDDGNTAAVVRAPANVQDDDATQRIPSGSRRISFPLAHLMQQGTWAMKQDFLSPESAIGKVLPPIENVAASGLDDPARAAQHLMTQLAISALDMPGLKNSKANVQKLVAMEDQELAETVFRHHLRPQLMVPSTVNLSTRGGILDMPESDSASVPVLFNTK